MEKRTFPMREYAILFFMTAVSVFSLLESIRILSLNFKANSPGTLPTFLSILLVILSVIMIWEARKTIPRGNEKFDKKSQAVWESIKVEVPKDVTFMLAAIIVYAFAMAKIGFEIATAIFSAGTMTYLTKGKWRVSLITSIVSVGIIYIIFGVVFKVVLP